MTTSIDSVQQAGALFVRATHSQSGSARLFDRTVALTPYGDHAVAYLGIEIDDPPGKTLLEVSTTGDDGLQHTTGFAITVLPTVWTMDDITLPPPGPVDPNAPPPPPDETPRLNALYTGVSPRAWEPGWQNPLVGQHAITSYFGEERSYNGGPMGGHHSGTDLAADEGTPIYATNHGTVVMAELTLERGNLIVLDHGGGVFSAYAHQSRFAAHLGDRVSKGQLLGYLGSTGLATGPHQHWEIAASGFVLDALRWQDGSQGF